MISRCLSGLAIALALAACERPSEAPRRPNVVLIVVDTLRADRLGAYGMPLDTSPELDALARKGVLFEQAWAPSSWTRASVGALLTSRHPRTLGIYKERGDSLDDGFETLAERFRAHGWRTVGATANPNLNDTFNFDQGFDHYVSSSVLWRWMDPEQGRSTWGEQPVPSTTELADALLDWIGDQQDEPGGPFYVQLDLMEVHEFRDKRLASRLDVEAFPERRDRRYLQAVRLASKEVGAFVERLSRERGFERTLFVILSDHGEGLGDHPGIRNSGSHGHLLYFGSQLHVPLVFYSTAGDLPAGLRVSEPVRLLDVMPTLLDYAGLPPAPDAVGVSLLPWLRGETVDLPLPDYFFAETRFRDADKSSVHGGGWSWIESRDGQRGTRPRELQALGGLENGAASDLSRKFPQDAARMAERLAEWQRANPEAAPSRRRAELSPEEKEQLRAIGYLP